MKPAAGSEGDVFEQLRLAGTLELVVEEGLKEQITLSIPGGWSAHDQMKLLTGKPGPLGTAGPSPVTAHPAPGIWPGSPASTWAGR